MSPMAADHHRYDDTDLERLYEGFAHFYRWASLVNDRVFGVAWLRRWVMGQASGRVLDVACGTGENFRHLGSAESVTAIDLSPAMLAQAKRRADQLGLSIDLRPMSAQALGFADHSFDTVTTAMTTCTFPDPVEALREMTRVLRPGGRILLVEHGRSSAGWFGRFQDRRADRHYERAACRWNQDVRALLAAAGLDIEASRERTLGVFAGIVAVPSA